VTNASAAERRPAEKDGEVELAVQVELDRLGQRDRETGGALGGQGLGRSVDGRQIGGDATAIAWTSGAGDAGERDGAEPGDSDGGDELLTHWVLPG
jgi:hypothetical protein